MQGAEVLTRFKADTKDFDSKTKAVNVSIGSIAKGVLAATGITKAFSAAWDMVRNSMDGAISRYDTMNNFPKVMSNLGIAANDAQASLDLMSDKLMGLPTTLDEGALAVQRFTSANNDVKKSTDIFLAVNNAILAGGAGAAIQSSALEQLSQAYAKGKPDVIEWRTLMTAMPAQLKQVANAMGYVNSEELGAALRDGTESMDSFIDTIVQLNETGLEGFSNFEEQARNATNGIQTALKNMRSRTVQGVTAMIEAVDKGLQDAKIGNIATILENIGNFFRDNLKKLAPYITQFIVKLAEIGKWINENRTFLEAIIVPLVTFIGVFATITKLISIVKGVAAAFGVLHAVLMANPIVLVIASITALIATFVYLWNHCEGFRNFWIGLWEAIKAAFFAVVNWVKEKIKETVESFNNLKNNIKSFINSIIDFFTSLPGKLYEIGSNLLTGLWNGIKSMKDWVVEKVKGIGKSILSGLKGVLGIKSPSKEFAIIGRYSVLGYTEALDDMQKDVQKQVAETFSVSPQLSATAGMHYSPNVNVINNVDIKQDPLGQMVNSIKTYSGGAKNDYNYGAGL
jgi:tape measure domain-containing protein